MRRLLLPLVDAAHRLAYRIGYPLMRQVWRVTRPHTRGAAVAIWSGGKVLVVRQSFRPGLGLPAGAIERGETARAAASRELLEEVGLEVEPAALIEVGEHRFPSEYRQVTTMLYELELGEPPLLQIDRREIVWAGWVDLEELAEQGMQQGLIYYRGERRKGGR